MREFWIELGNQEYCGQVFEYKPSRTDVIHVIEKSAYDALAKRVAELEAKASEQRYRRSFETIQECQDFYCRELAAARQENERLQYVINYDMPHPQLTQANARIAELEAELQKQKDFRFAMQKAMDEDSEREQKLVAALEFYARDGFDTGDWVMDEGAKAREALKAHTASAEKGGA